LHHHGFGIPEDGKKKDMGGYGITMLGEWTDGPINHEFSLLEELLSHCAHVFIIVK
jgi:hypothetical protein